MNRTKNNKQSYSQDDASSLDISKEIVRRENNPNISNFYSSVFPFSHYKEMTNLEPGPSNEDLNIGNVQKQLKLIQEKIKTNKKNLQDESKKLKSFNKKSRKSSFYTATDKIKSLKNIYNESSVEKKKEESDVESKIELTDKSANLLKSFSQKSARKEDVNKVREKGYKSLRNVRLIEDKPSYIKRQIKIESKKSTKSDHQIKLEKNETRQSSKSFTKYENSSGKNVIVKKKFTETIESVNIAKTKRRKKKKRKMSKNAVVVKRYHELIKAKPKLVTFFRNSKETATDRRRRIRYGRLFYWLNERVVKMKKDKVILKKVILD